MGEPIVLEDFKERVILVGVSEQDGDDAEDSLAELAELVKTAGASVAGTLIQKRELIHPGTYVGTGKVAEIAELLEHTGATGIVCDDELSPAQLKNLETMLNTKVMDRTLIILDIFAARATTSEGKIQVELAQLKYRLSRLTGLGRSMSRLGGGIGTRGPGEKKLEIDRRLINDRIAQLNRELKEVVKHREIARAKRERKNIRRTVDLAVFQIDPMDFFIVCKCQIDFCFIRKILMGQTKGNHILCKLSICKIKRYVTCFF